MANPNISELITVGIESRTGEIRDNVTANNAVLVQLKKKGRMVPVSGGTQINEEISYAANGNGQYYSGYDQLSVAAQDTLTSANYDWKQYAVAVTISGREKRINSGKEGIINLLDARLDNAESTMANDITTGIYSDGTGSGGKTITGLDAAVPEDPTTGTYGGINRATASNAFWKSQLYDPSSTPTSTTIQGYMNILWAKCIRGADHPDLIIAGQTIWSTWIASLQLIQRVTDPASADLGFPTTKFFNCDVVLDNVTGMANSGNDMYFLNTKYLRWRPHKDCNMVPLDPETRYAVNQDASVAFLGFMGNLTCAGAKFQGRGKFD